MKDYFYEEVLKCFDNAVFTRYGSVAIAWEKTEDDTAFRYVAYDISTEDLSKLSDNEKEDHIVVDKTLNIANVDFNDKLSVFEKINELVTSFEVEIYNQ